MPHNQLCFSSLNKTLPVDREAKKLQSIPTVDMSSPNIGSQLKDAFRGIGFCTLINHGVSKEMIDLAFEWSNNFFNSEEKNSIPMSEGKFKGYWRKNERKEMLEFGDFQNQEERKYYPRIEGFGEFFQKYQEKLYQLHHQVLGQFEKTLKLPSGSLIKMSDMRSQTVRILHYPEVNLEEIKKDGLIRAQPHTDFGLITLLVQKPGYGQNGLRVLSKEGVWIRVTPPDYSIVINIGDALQLLTNGILKSTIHSVWVDDDVIRKLEEGEIEKSPERKSIAMFFHPSDHVVLKSLPECGQSSCEAILAKDFILGRNISAKMNTSLSQVPEN